MLDFYLIKDDQAKPAYPEQAGLQFVGSLDERTFLNLKKSKLIGSQFDYYSDFRWGTTMILHMRREITRKQMSDDSDVKKRIALLEIAEKQDAGLMAFSD